MKVVILAGGYGKRMGNLTKNRSKHMLQIVGKPILEWNMEFIKNQLEFKDIIIVTGYKEEVIKKYFKDGEDFGVSIEYRSQNIENKMGLAEALKCVKNDVEENFVVLLGDNLYHGDFKNIIYHHLEYNLTATIHAEEVDNPSRYGVISVKKNSNIIESIEEKPKTPKSNLVITGFYVFNKDIFDGIENIDPSERGELELTDAINYLCPTKRVEVNKMDGWRKDIGYPEDILEASMWIFKNKKDTGNKIYSKINDNNTIVQPVFIGKNTIIENSIIGPFVSIGGNVKILNCEIKNSIILDNQDVSDANLNDVII